MEKCTICGQPATQKIVDGKLSVFYCNECIKPMTDMGFKPVPLGKDGK